MFGGAGGGAVSGGGGGEGILEPDLSKSWQGNDLHFLFLKVVFKVTRRAHLLRKSGLRFY